VIRAATDADRPVLQTIQRFLDEPAPELLDPAAGAEVLVSTVDAEDGHTGDSTRGTDLPVGYLLWLPGDPVYAAELVVAPAYRRQGRGRALFTTMLGLQPSGTRVRLQVAESNHGAQALYESLGFSVIGRDPDAYESGAGRWMEMVVG
jgi:ribosomal-protein-alanine N-acetyltransferase